jgi:hypothetical protein
MLSPRYKPAPLSPLPPGGQRSAIGSSNQSESPPSATSSPAKTAIAAKAQFDQKLEQLHSERTLADHELAVLRQTVADLEARVALLHQSALADAAAFDQHARHQDTLLEAAQSDLAKLTRSSGDDVSPRAASLSLTKSSAQVLLKRIGVLELYRDRVEAQLETHRALVDSRVAAVAAARDAAYQSLVSVI